MADRRARLRRDHRRGGLRRPHRRPASADRPGHRDPGVRRRGPAAPHLPGLRRPRHPGLPAPQASGGTRRGRRPSAGPAHGGGVRTGRRRPGDQTRWPHPRRQPRRGRADRRLRRGHQRLRTTLRPDACRRRERGLHRTPGHRTRPPAQLALRGRGPARGLPLRQLHPLHRPAPPGAGRGGGKQRSAVRGPRRQDGPDAAAFRPRPDVHPAGPRRPRLVRRQPARRRRRRRPGRPGRRRREERGQGTRPRRHPRHDARGRGPHRRRPRARRLEDRLGPHRLRRLPRHPHDPPDHLAGLRLLPRGTARTRPGTPRRPRPRSGPVRSARPTRLLLQGPGGGGPSALGEQYAALSGFAEQLRGVRDVGDAGSAGEVGDAHGGDRGAVPGGGRRPEQSR